jgi:MFS family permease
VSSKRRDWALLITLTFAFSFGFAVYGGLFQNYFREVIHGEPQQLGILESLREIPGLLTAVTAGLLVALAETRLCGAALIASAVGIAATGWVASYWPLVGVTVFWSIGMHLWFSLSPAITLSLAEGREGGKHLGRMAGVGAAAGLAALGATRLLKPYVAYHVLFNAAGALIVAAGLLALFIRVHPARQPRQGMVLRREYGLYYVLTFLEGCRRQIFGTFAPFVLIMVYHASIETMLNLAFLNAAVSIVVQPLIGRAIDRLGERKVMMAYYAILMAVFAGYAFISNRTVLFGFYMVDNLLFGCSMAITTYVNRIVRPTEMTPTLTMGTTMNHVAAVLVPVTGGILWKTLGNFQIPFFIGIAVLIASLVVSRRLPAHLPAPAKA